MRAVIGYTLLVMLVLLILNALYLLISQQDEIGVGNYTATSALLYVGLRLPQSAFDMLPIASLIGSLLSLGNLARSMELVVVRAAGVSRKDCSCESVVASVKAGSTTPSDASCRTRSVS